MRVAEVLAIMGTTAAVGGGIGAYIELNHESDAREIAISAEACLNTYGTDKNGNISQDTLDCLKNGWVPNGHRATPNLKAGDPSGLYMGFIKEEQAKGSHLKVAPILAITAGGLAVGSYLAYKIEQEESPESTKSSPPKRSTQPVVNGSAPVRLSK